MRSVHKVECHRSRLIFKDINGVPVAGELDLSYNAIRQLDEILHKRLHRAGLLTLEEMDRCTDLLQREVKE